ncbi:basic amino acid/polyamine antiporter [Pontimonas salivibrio]|uniref:Basic amino acid/polyamine antiporter n=1 Tax=Pontimonas salivibrio TaxID=1159327 RepID=A0A2L2BPA6_9MICO|nr:APC family permease [Pontimonas salivibrio]AVG23499.1 basic amino acid/polyamine antiporter [Pontimonas salivibrio]
MQALERRLGVTGSIAIGVAAMVGAGVFFVWAPAWDLAGEWMLVSLALATIVATLNGLVTTQLAIRVPTSGGIYSYGRAYRGEFVGFVAGWLFITGKTASAAAIALIAATYVLPDQPRGLAVAFIVAFSAVVISGIRATATLSIGIVAVVVGGLVFLAVPAIASEGVSITFGSLPGWGVLSAAGLMFFSFAGYARMATLGEEVRDPVRTLPRAIIGALVIVLTLYALLALALIPTFAANGVSPAPLTALVSGDAMWLVGLLALVASLGSLLAILAGLSRTSLQMARHRDLPGALAHLSPATKGPLFSELAVAAGAITLVLVTDPLWLVGLSGTGVLSYYAIGHYSALAQPRAERFLPPVVPILGLVLCLVLVVSLPVASLIAGVSWTLLGVLWFVIARSIRRRKNPPQG